MARIERFFPHLKFFKTFPTASFSPRKVAMRVPHG